MEQAICIIATVTAVCMLYVRLQRIEQNTEHTAMYVRLTYKVYEEMSREAERNRIKELGQ